MNKELNAYKQLVTKYHHTLDLVSATALEHFDEKIADCLLYARLIEEKAKKNATILDVGSGAGLPGIVLAIVLPEHPIFLVERRQKRAAFLKIVATQLGLKNTRVFSTDVSELKEISADVVTALAVGSFSLLYCITKHLHAKDVILMSRKGESFAVEIKDLDHIISSSATLLTNHNVSRETIYDNLVAISCVGGLKCSRNLP